ncbi:uncharacterized protein LOC116413443 [Galleria mellonella]|uniref:Uncharacterized protein LOC116413443 n=1 Tax=Galleria mellonella TaxID=7137 RepID=A0A6J3C4W9_GALME|nr:uncharacterized protein LOC116413443 [Galleria mellonella]
MDLYSKLSASMDEIVQLFQTRMGEVEKSIQQISDSSSKQQYLVTLTREYYDFKSLMWKAVGMLKAQVEMLTLGLDQHETASRRKVLLLHGISESPEENVKESVVKVLSERLKVTNKCISDISVCHRLGSKLGKSRPILVRFLNYSSRSEVWNKKTLLKGTKTTVSEFLIKSRQHLFTEARKHFGVRNCWTAEGKVVILLPDHTRCKIEQMSELRSLTIRFPVIAAIQSKATTGADKATKKTSTASTVATRRQGISNK